MDGEKKKTNKPIVFVVVLIFFGKTVMDISEVICYRVTLMGREGLWNAALVLSVYLAGLLSLAGAFFYGGVKSVIYGVRLGRLYRQGGDMGEVFSVYFGRKLPALTVIFGVIFLGVGGISFVAGVDTGGPFYIHMSEISGNGCTFGNISLLWNVACDLREERTECCTVNEGYSFSFGGQYLAYFGYEDEEVWAPEMFTAQVGACDRGYIGDMLPGRVNAVAEVYEKTGFIKCITPERDVSGFEGYTYLYNIYVDNGMIVYTYEGSGTEPDNLSWCGFKPGEGGDIHNSLFMFGTSGERAALELDLAKVLCKEVCLYAWVDGGYEPVSNTLSVNGEQ